MRTTTSGGRRRKRFCLHFIYAIGNAQRDGLLRALHELTAEVEVRESVDSGKWLLLVKQAIVDHDDVEDMADRIHEIVEPLGGDYDGWETDV